MMDDVGVLGFPLSIQVCPKKGINPTILLLGWDWDHQTYSNREGYGSLGFINPYESYDHMSANCFLSQASWNQDPNYPSLRPLW